MSWNPDKLVRKVISYREFTPQEVKEYVLDVDCWGLCNPPTKYKKRVKRLCEKSIKKFEEIRKQYHFRLNEKMRKSRPSAGKELVELVEDHNDKIYQIVSNFFAREVGAYV